MDTASIVVLALGIIFIIGGPIVAHIASKNGGEVEKEETNKPKSR